MKIAYVIEDFSMKGGAERIIAAKANHLSSVLGHEVTIISVYADDRPQGYPLADGVGLTCLGVPFAKKGGGLIGRTVSRTATLVRAAIRLNQAIHELNPDIIFFATTLSALLLPLCNTRARRIYESHLARRFNPFNTFFPLMERKADLIVSLTHDDAEEYSCAKKVVVIPNFIDPPQRFVGYYGARRAVAVGRLERQKGFDTLISVWAEAIKQQPGWQLDIYGEGPCRQSLQAQIDSLGLNDSVHLRGRIDNMMQTYANYSLHLMTSRYEGLPMTLIEAQACGLPSLTFNFKYGAKEVVSDHESGLIVPQNDRFCFLKSLVLLMQNEPLRRQYGEKAKEVGLKFNKEEVMKSWQKLIEEVTLS